jgi:hypothetical protein
LNNADCVKTCYEYFKSIADMDQFNKIPVPIIEQLASEIPPNTLLILIKLQQLDDIHTAIFGENLNELIRKNSIDRFTLYELYNRGLLTPEQIQLGRL